MIEQSLTDREVDDFHDRQPGTDCASEARTTVYRAAKRRNGSQTMERLGVTSMAVPGDHFCM